MKLQFALCCSFLLAAESTQKIVAFAVKDEIAQCWGLPHGDTSNGNHIELQSCDGTEKQQWVVSEGQIKYASNISKCIDAGGMAAGYNLQIFDCNGARQQKLGIDKSMGTVYLTWSSSDASLCIGQVGNSMQLLACSDDSNEKWSVLPVNSIITPLSNSSMCLSLKDGNTTNGNVVEVAVCTGMSNQQWSFKLFSNQISYAADESKCVDAGRMVSGIDVQLYDCNKLPPQKWGYDSKMATLYLAASSGDASQCLDSTGFHARVAPCDQRLSEQWSLQVWADASSADMPISV